MAPSEAQLEYSTNSEVHWRGPVPDGCQPGRFASRGDKGSNLAVEEMLAALDALDDEAPTPPAPPENPTQSKAILEPGAPAVEPVPAPLARFLALKADAARQKEEQRETAKQARARQQARVRKQRQRAKERAATAIDVTASVDDLLADLMSTPWREFQATGWAREYDQRLAALLKATANHEGDPFLRQMKGREIQLVQGWVAQQRARALFGPTASLTQIADQANMTKSSAQKLVKNIAKLEERGRPWHSKGIQRPSESP